MAEREVTELISTLQVGKPFLFYELPNDIPPKVMGDFGKAECMEKVEGPEVALFSFKRTFDPSTSESGDERCAPCPLKKNCVIVGGNS